MSYDYIFKNVLILVLLFFVEGGLTMEGSTTDDITMFSTTMASTTMDSTTMTSSTMTSTIMPEPNTTIVISQLQYGVVNVYWTPGNDWNDCNVYEYYKICWDRCSEFTNDTEHISWSDVTSDTEYSIGEDKYNESSSEITIVVCPTEDNITCIDTCEPSNRSQIIVHPVNNLTAKINEGTLIVTWNYTDTDIDGNEHAIIWWIDKEYYAEDSPWNQTKEINGASRNVCISAVIENELTKQTHKQNDSSRWECKVTDENGPENDNLALILGCSIGIPVFVILIVAVVLLKRHHKLSGSGRPSSYRRDSDHIEIHENPQKSDEVLKSEFAKLKDIKHDRSCDIARRYRDRNFYTDVLPYDDTLVTLNKVDYINASYILNKKFITTPDPMPDQDNDIWQLIYECDVRVIIRISTEGEQKPMAQYVPDQIGDSWVMGADELQVNLVSSQQWDGYAENTIKLKKNGESREIKHFLLTNWPESSTQNQQDQAKAKVLRLISSGRSFSKKHGDKPILIHCGAGSGRTGTVAGIWHLMDQHDRGEMANTYRCVEAMRKDRVWMVQKQEQYFFMYNCIMEYQNHPHIYRGCENEYGQYE